MNDESILIVGLGNPGEDYAHTLHNVGFDVIDILAEMTCSTFCKDECGAKAFHVGYSGKTLILAKPQSCMNTSGGPVKELIKKYDISLDCIFVVHDDLDLPPGKIRIKRGGGSGGHNGIKSIIDKIGNPNFVRVKVGIGRPMFNKTVTDWVLSRPLKQINNDLQEGISLAAEEVLFMMDNGIEKAQEKYN